MNNREMLFDKRKRRRKYKQLGVAGVALRKDGSRSMFTKEVVVQSEIN